MAGVGPDPRHSCCAGRDWPRPGRLPCRGPEGGGARSRRIGSGMERVSPTGLRLFLRPPRGGLPKATPSGRGFLLVCRACLATGRCKSSAQPDGGEGQATRKGGTARCRLKEAIAKMRPDGQEPDNEAVASGRVGKRPRSPFPSSVAAVNPAGVHRRRPSLPRETCRMSRSRD